jgi:VanZ family protein
LGGTTGALRLRALWLAIGYALVVATAWGSLTPRPPSIAFAAGDTLLHGGAYALLAFWFGQLYPGWRRETVVVVAFIGLGVALEFAQAYWSIYRHFDWWDAAASGAGVLSAWLLLQTPLGWALAWLDSRLARAEA